MHGAQLLWPPVCPLLLCTSKQVIQYGLNQEAMATALAGEHQISAACCCSAGHQPNVYRWTEPTLEHSNLLPSSTGLEQTGAMYLHSLPMLFLPVLPEDYSDFPVLCS